MRKCKGCGKLKPIEEFAQAARNYKRHKCVQCYSIQKGAERQVMREKLVEYKKTLCCEHCGVRDFRLFEFHHKDPTTKTDEVSNMAQRKNSWARILEEIQKCLCLCANCHRIVHSNYDPHFI